MRITYLKLQNFVNIYAGMKRKEVEIDLNKSKNKLIIFAGRNGSGKTSILAELHPFATVGNMDVRNDTSLIIEGEDGYKEIHFEDGENNYVIKHHYSNSGKTKGTKSFINKNGTELNSNGNVKSFKDCVLEELGIDQDLLKLMRLGSNVTSLVGLKSTNRKSFASKLFTDLDIYGGFFKKCSEEYRNIRAVIKNLTDKLNKFNITDESEFEKQLIILADEIKKYEGIKSAYAKDMNIIEAKLNDIDLSGEDEVNRRFIELESLLKSADNMLNIVKDIHQSKAEYLLDREREKNTINEKIINIKSNVDKLIFEKDMYYKQKEELEEKLHVAVSNVRLKSLLESITEYENKVSTLEKKLENRTRYDNYQLMRLKDHVDKTLSMVNSMSHFNIIDVQRIAKGILNQQNVSEMIELNRSKMRFNYDKLQAEIISIENTKVDLDGYVIPDNTCKDDCPFKEFYFKVVGRKDNLGKLVEERNKLAKDMQSSDDLFELFKLVNMIKDHVEEFNCPLPLPIDYNSYDILLNLSRNKRVVNTEKINLAIDDAESFDTLNRYKEELTKYKNEYELSKDFGIDVVEVENKILEIEEIVNSKSDDMSKLGLEIDKLNNSLIEHNKTTEEVAQALEYKDKMSDIQDEHRVIQGKMFEYNKLRGMKSNYTNDIERLSKEINQISGYISTQTTRREQLSFSIKEYRNIKDELEAMQMLFEEADTVRDAISSSKGIPVLFLNVYLKNCPIMMNTLLEKVYGGSLQVADKFIIDENEFRIPYKKDGILINDVIYTSQGENSFVSIVLSLSLLVQSMTRYDVICLDELDGPLDMENREAFIDVLYKFIEQVGCQQVFLISHNNMFHNEPVDIIQTSNYDLEDYKQANVIFKA